jgi:hypothetical protein
MWTHELMVNNERFKSLFEPDIGNAESLLKERFERISDTAPALVLAIYINDGKTLISTFMIFCELLLMLAKQLYYCTIELNINCMIESVLVYSSQNDNSFHLTKI